MPDRARHPLPLGSLAAVLAIVALSARPVPADMVLTADGKWAPLENNVPSPSAEEEPNDDVLLQSDENRLDATYETVRSPKVNKPAAFVRKLRSTESVRNQHFREGFNNASSSLWNDAAEAFHAAAAELNGFGKQDALWNFVRATAETQDAERTSAAIDELLAAFPKSFYFADVHILRARIAVSKNDPAGAAAALDKIKAAPGMNFRDLYRGEQTRVYLTMERAKKYDAAASEYRILIQRMDGEKDAALVATTKQQCQVGLGNCLLALKKEAEAGTFFLGATESRDPDVLAGAYAGLGDIALTDAKAQKDAGKLPEAKAALEKALLHYLRVSKLYKPNVTDDGPVFRSLENQAKVFAALFDMGNRKELDLIDRAWRSYDELVKMLPQSPQRNAIVRDFVAVDKIRKEAQPPPPPPATPEKPK